VGSPDLPSAGASVGWPLAADDVEVAEESPLAVGVGSPLAAVLVAEALVEAESLAVGVGSPLAVVLVGEALVDVASLALELADADTELESPDAEVGAGVGAEPDARRVVVCEVEVMVDTDALTPEMLGEAEDESAALKAATSAGVSRTVIFSTTVLVSLMLVAGSRFT